MYSTKDDKAKSHRDGLTSDCFLQYQGKKTVLSATEYQTIQEILTMIRKGIAFTIVSQNKYMTAEEAADFLNVSLAYLIQILDDGEIPYLKVENHRQVLTEDVVLYQQQRDKNRHQILQEFSQGLKEDGLYDLDYDEVNEIINS